MLVQKGEPQSPLAGEENDFQCGNLQVGQYILKKAKVNKMMPELQRPVF
jgi:hypothetical protein